MSSSFVPKLPSLSDSCYIELFQKAKDKKAWWNEFYRSVKSLEVIANGSKEKNNITQMIAILINNDQERGKNHVKDLKNAGDKFKKCKNDLDEANQNIQLLSASLIEKDAAIEEYKNQLSDFQKRIDEMIEAAAAAKGVECSKCDELQHELDQYRAAAEANDREKSLENKNLNIALEYLKGDNAKLLQKISDLREVDKTRDLLLKNVQNSCEKQKNELEKQYNEALGMKEKAENDNEKVSMENNALRSKFEGLVEKIKANDENFDVIKLWLDEIMCNREEIKKLYIEPASSEEETSQQNDQQQLNLELPENRNRLALSENCISEEETPRNPAPLLSQIEHEDNEEQFNWEPCAKRIRLALSTLTNTVSRNADAAASDSFQSAASTQESLRDNEEED